MIIVNCKFNKKAKELYKSVNVKIKELERFTNFILNEYKGTRNIWNYDLEIRIIDCDTSGYYFGCNEMEIGTKTSKRSIAKKKEWYLSSYFHELCHFAQDNLDKVKDSKQMQMQQIVLTNIIKTLWKYKQESLKINILKST